MHHELLTNYSHLYNRVLVLLDRFGSFILVGGEEAIVSFAKTKFQVAAENISNITSFTGSTFSGNFNSSQTDSAGGTSITIPQSLFTDINISNPSRIVYTAYPNDSPLFHSTTENISSIVIGAYIPGVNVDNLSENDSVLINIRTTLRPEVN